MAKFFLILISLTIGISATAQVNNSGNSQSSLNTGDSTIYEEVDTAAHFPGGKPEWNKYIAKTLNPGVGVENGAKTGRYNVKIKLTVMKDGTLQDFKPVTKYGHGFEEEVIKSLKLSPKWVPAIRNGVPVNSSIVHSQVFIISSE